jgi:hypothetical protein
MPALLPRSTRRIVAAALAALACAAATSRAAPPCVRVEHETPSVLEVVWKISPETVNALRAVHDRLAAVAEMRPRLVVCGSPEVNARVVAGVVPEIRVDAGLLEFTQSPEELAGVLAHEFAHLLMSHREKKVEALKEAYADAVEHGGTVRSFLEQVTSFSRAAEREADDVGFKLAVKAGFAPGGAREFARRMLKSGVAAGEGYLSTHPGLGERAWYSGRLTANENFRAIAEAQLAAGDVEGLERTVAAWKAQAPDSGGAAYYGAFAAVLARRPPSDVAAELEDAVSYFGIDRQSVLGEEYEVQTRDAALALCVALHREGNTIQALNCVKRLRADDVRAFRELTGWRGFLVLGRGREKTPSAVFGARLPGAPITISTCKRVVQREGLRRAEPWRAMREPQRAPERVDEGPVACDPSICDCRAASLEGVTVAQ